MPDPTPEARRVALAIADVVIGDLMTKDLLRERTVDAIERLVRVAVTAETERCAKIDPLLIACPSCHTEAGNYCNNYCFHAPRWRAAVRQAAPEPAEPNTQHARNKGE